MFSESLEELDIKKLQSLNLTDRKSTRPKSLKTKRGNKVEPKPRGDLFSPKSRQLDLLETVDVVVKERKDLWRTSSLPNLKASNPEDGSSSIRRRSFPDSTEFLNQNSAPEWKPVARLKVEPTSSREERRFIKTHQRSRSDTSTILYFQPVSNKCEEEEEGEGEESDNADGGGGGGGDGAVTGSWSRIVPASTGWYPRPRANQTLVQFLSESGGEGNRRGGRALLDRENAHFILSEAMISTFEQMNFERCLQQREEAQGGR